MKDMFVCDNCEQSFHIDDAGRRFERVGERSTDGWYENTCPHCGSSDISEAEQCERCGEWVPDTRNGYCDCCAGEMFNRFCDATSDFTQMDREFICEELDWDDWCANGPDYRG